MQKQTIKRAPTLILAALLSAGLALSGCLPQGGATKAQQKQLDSAMATNAGAAFVAAVKANFLVMRLADNATDGEVAGQIQQLAQQTLAQAAPNPAVRVASCGSHVVAYVVQGYEQKLGLAGLKGPQAMRVAAAVQKALPSSHVALVNASKERIMGLAQQRDCADLVLNAAHQSTPTDQRLGTGPVVVMPYEVAQSTLGNFDSNQKMYRYAGPNGQCEQQLQECALGADKTWACAPATSHATMPLTKDVCVQPTNPMSVPENTDITAWEHAVANNLITVNDSYTVSGGVVTKVTKAVAQQLDCPKQADATGTVTNPQVSRTSGWTSGGSKAPVSRPGTVTACQAGWEGELYAKYERRDCTLKKITSTGQGAASTQSTTPQTVFRLYYIGEKCRTSSPLPYLATCPASTSVTNSNGYGLVPFVRNFGMKQAVALTWSHSKNTSTSTIAKSGDATAGDYTVLPALDGNRPFSNALAEALRQANILDKTTYCDVGTKCDTNIEHTDRFDVRNAECPYQYKSVNGQCKWFCEKWPDGIWRVIGAGEGGPCNQNGDEASPPSATCPSGSWEVNVGTPQSPDIKCEMSRVCEGGNPNDNCKRTCADGSPGPVCTVPKECPVGSYLNPASGQCVAVPVCADGSAIVNGTCPGNGTSGGVRCPTGTTEVKTGNVIVGCTKAAICEPCPADTTFNETTKECVPNPATLPGGLTIFYEPGVGGVGNLNIFENYCRYKDTQAVVPVSKCYPFDSSSQQPNCYGSDRQCVPSDDTPSTVSGNGISTILSQAINSYYINPEALAQIKLVPLAAGAGADYAQMAKLISESSQHNIVILTEMSNTGICSAADGSGYFTVSGKKFCTVFGNAANTIGFGTEPQSLVNYIGQSIFGGQRSFMFYSVNTNACLGVQSPIGCHAGVANMENIADGLRRELERLID